MGYHYGVQTGLEIILAWVHMELDGAHLGHFCDNTVLTRASIMGPRWVLQMTLARDPHGFRYGKIWERSSSQ